MIIVNLSGGLGNQLFQYAFGRMVASKYNHELKLDGNYYFSEVCKKSEVPRSYLLDKFNIKANLASIQEVNKINPLWKKIIRKIKYKINISSNPSIYSGKEFNEKDNQYYIGFWQNEKYFKTISSLIKKEITLKERMSLVSEDFSNKIDSNNSVSIHVRRTDILNPENIYNGICDINYYHKAISLIKEKVNNPVFFVFSDDIEWCKNNLKFIDNTIFVSNSETKDFEELILMSKCKHNIIANSSFSWWGAWLNENQNKIVIAPSKWVLRGETNFKDIIPSSWMRV